MRLDLDIWTADKVSEHFNGKFNSTETTLRDALDKYTEDKKIEILEYAEANSPFYREKLSEISSWEAVPFTTSEDLKERETALLCVSPSQISRIVTMQTSGTTGKAKRVYFTEEDQQLTVDYFNHGMRLIVDERDIVLILMPSAVQGSIGLLLGQGLQGIGVKSIEYGLPFQNRTKDSRQEAEEIVELIREQNVTCIVAMPTHMIAVARAAKKLLEETGEDTHLRSILLSAEFVPERTVYMLENVFKCTVFEHYGMTEMGLGCAVSCGYSRGYHIRESDLYVELINPLSGELVREKANKSTPGFSDYGEIVFTTLTRKGMPFIRYRTGDFSRWIIGCCPCGSILKRLDKVIPGDDRIKMQYKKSGFSML